MLRAPIPWKTTHNRPPRGAAITLRYALLGAASFVAGLQNALAGGGSFLILPALLLTGLDPRAANVTATIALFPGQLANGVVGRRNATGTPSMTLAALVGLSLVGGGLGAVLLLVTPVSLFAALMPWLVLFATLLFAWGTFRRNAARATRPPGAWATGATQFAISVYGGYFGGGIGILMLATLTLCGQALRNAGATKNVLVAFINSSAVLIFLFAPDVAWRQVAVVGIAALAGGQLGAYVLVRINERALRILHHSAWVSIDSRLVRPLPPLMKPRDSAKSDGLPAAQGAASSAKSCGSPRILAVPALMYTVYLTRKSTV